MFKTLEDDTASMLIKNFYVTDPLADLDDHSLDLHLDVQVGLAAPIRLGSKVRLFRW
jgi:hypothetical protein